jgi:hypothetical protein
MLGCTKWARLLWSGGPVAWCHWEFNRVFCAIGMSVQKWHVDARSFIAITSRTRNFGHGNLSRADRPNEGSSWALSLVASSPVLLRWPRWVLSVVVCADMQLSIGPTLFVGDTCTLLHWQPGVVRGSASVERGHERNWLWAMLVFVLRVVKWA